MEMAMSMPTSRTEKRLRPSKCPHKLETLTRNLWQFLKGVWPSLLLIGVVGAATIGIWLAPHAFHRLFPITFYSTSGDIVWTQFAYPYRDPIFSSIAAALIGILIPLGLILFCQIWIRSFCNAAYAILGLTYSLVTGTFIIVVLKKLIGGLRPHFLSVCRPVIQPSTTGTGFKNVMFTINQVCTGTDKRKIAEAIESFPSGHSEIAFAGLFYLAIYLFAHLRIQHRFQPGYWRMMACILPILLATYVASTLVLVYHHHGYDVVFGSLLGILVALSGYRMCFRGVFYKDLNTIPACHEEDGGEDGLPR